MRSLVLEMYNISGQPKDRDPQRQSKINYVCSKRSGMYQNRDDMEGSTKNGVTVDIREVMSV